MDVLVGFSIQQSVIKTDRPSVLTPLVLPGRGTMWSTSLLWRARNYETDRTLKRTSMACKTLGTSANSSNVAFTLEG